MPFNTNHPRHVKRNIPYILFKRLDDIVSNPIRKKFRKEELKQRLLDHYYPKKLVIDAYMKKYTINNDTKSCDRVYALPLTYNSSIQSKTYNNIRASIHNLTNHTNTKDIFQNKRLVIAYKRNYSLLSFLKQYNFYINKCNEPRCKTCPIIQCGPLIKLPGRKVIKPNISMNCKTEHTIYCLLCTGCEKIYIGRTNIPLRQRITLHRQQTLNPQYAILYANKHFHSCNTNFKVVPLFYAGAHSTTSMLNFIESYFIRLFIPELNSSL